MIASSSALPQQPQAPQVDQYFHVFPPQLKTFLAQAKFSSTLQGAFPLLHEAQFILLTYHRPTSSEPLVLWSWAWEFPPLSCLMMHWQQDWDQPLYLEHAAAISAYEGEVPQWQFVHLFEGQFPPQLLARTKARPRASKSAILDTDGIIKIFIIIKLYSTFLILINWW